MKLHSLFASPIYSGRLLPEKSTLLRELRSEARLIRKGDRQGQAWSSENYLDGFTSYSSLDQLHRFSSPFKNLEERINPHIATYLRALRLQVRPTEIRLTRMWLNIMGQNCTHPMHIHPLSVISGTFYVQVPPKSAAIRFEDPRLPSFMARPMARNPETSQGSAYLHEVRPRAGDLVLFESWIRHEVPPQRSKTERISVSFNYDWITD